jgi:hypothetical protein
MLSVGASAAATPVCIAIDPATDQLSEEESRMAIGLLSQSVAVWGRTLVTDGCEEPWLLSHVKIGEQLSVGLRGEGTAHVLKAAGFGALVDTYLELLRAHESARGGRVTEKVVDQAAVAQPESVLKPASPALGPARRAWFGFGKGHGHFYARLGYHGTIRHDLDLGPSLGLGYRVEFGRVIFDVSTVNLNFWRENPYQDYHTTWNAYLRLMAFRYLDDYLNLNLYVGGGLSYGRTDTHDSFRASGLQTDLGLGYEILRNTWARTFVQVVATLPLYQVYARDYYYPGIYEPDYAFSVAASVGVGF